MKGLYTWLLVGLACCVAPLAAEEQRRFSAQSSDLNKIRNNIQKQNRETVSPDEKAGFEWGNMAGMAMKLLVGGPKDGATNDRTDTIAQLAYMSYLHQKGELTWTKMISLGMEIILSLVDGGQSNNIDRQDLEPSPVENILSAVISYLTGSKDLNEVNIMAKQATELLGLLVSLLDALRTSFSQRSSYARSIGSTDSLAEAAVAATSLFKGLVQSYDTDDEVCIQRYVCQANTECVEGATDTGYLFCQMGTYGISYLLERSTYIPFETYSDAGRKGRIGDDCVQSFRECHNPWAKELKV